MAIFRKLHTAFWQDAKVIEELTPEDKFFFIYLSPFILYFCISLSSFTVIPRSSSPITNSSFFLSATSPKIPE